MNKEAAPIAADGTPGWKVLVGSILSVIVPGAGHLLVGRRRRALVFFAADLVVIVFGVWLWRKGEIGLVRLLVQPRWVRAVVAGNLLLGLWRLVAVVDLLILERTPMRVVAAVPLGFVLALVLVVPHLLVMTRALSLLGVLETVFPSQAVVAEAFERYRPPETTTTTTEPPTTTRPTIPGVPPELEPFEPTEQLIGLEGPNRELAAQLGTERVTVLLAGGDAGPGRGGMRTDTMIVASIDLRTGKGVLITISREITGVPLPPFLRTSQGILERQQSIFDLAKAAEEGGYSKATDPLPEEFDPCCWLDRINAIYPFTREYTRTYPNTARPGMAALRDTLSYALGIPIHYYVLVDMAGFVDLVDALGGVTVTSQESMHVRMSPAKEGEEEIVIEITPGRHRLDGRTALAYVRNRTDSNDIVRTRRQRCFVREVVGQMDLKTVIIRFDRIASAIQRHTRTDIPVEILPDLVQVVAEMDRSGIGTAAIQPGFYADKVDYRGLPVFNQQRAKAEVKRLMEGRSSSPTGIDGSECG